MSEISYATPTGKVKAEASRKVSRARDGYSLVRCKLAVFKPEV